MSLDALDETSRDAVLRLSVFGLSGWDEGLSALGVSAPESALKQLVAADLVVEQADSRLSGAREWVFKHALVRDVAYASLGEAQRKVLHAMAGAWLAKMGEDAATVAKHFDLGERPGEAATPGKRPRAGPSPPTRSATRSAWPRWPSPSPRARRRRSRARSCSTKPGAASTRAPPIAKPRSSPWTTRVRRGEPRPRRRSPRPLRRRARPRRGRHRRAPLRGARPGQTARHRRRRGALLRDPRLAPCLRRAARDRPNAKRRIYCRLRSRAASPPRPSTPGRPSRSSARPGRARERARGAPECPRGPRAKPAAWNARPC